VPVEGMVREPVRSEMCSSEGRNCEPCYAATRMLLWSRRGTPTKWLLLVIGLCVLVLIKAAEGRVPRECAGTPVLSRQQSSNRHSPKPPMGSRPPAIDSCGAAG
jgi:hypothetical protein